MNTVKPNDIVSHCDFAIRDSRSRLIAEMGNGISPIAMRRDGETDVGCRSNTQRRLDLHSSLFTH